MVLVFYIFCTECALVVKLENNAQKYNFSIKFSGTPIVNPSPPQLQTSITDTTPFLDIRPRKTYDPQPQVVVLMITSALLGPGLHILVSYVCIHMCVQTRVHRCVSWG